jgi:ABC-type sugar transport system permease subunit
MKRESNADWFAALLFLLPAVIFFLVFILYPFFDGLAISFTSWDGFSKPVFVGVSNYAELFQEDSPFLKSLGNNTLFAIYTVLAKNVLAIALAIVLTSKLRGRGFYRTILFLPTCLSFVAIGLIWGFIFSPDFGILNAILGYLGVKGPISWLGEPNLALASVAFVDIWKWTGYHVVLYIAGLQMLPKDIYEATAIDGASRSMTLFSVTIPMLAPVIIINVVISLMGAYGVFDLVYVMTRGGPYNSTQTILTNMYEVTFRQYQIGLGSAIVFMLFVIVLTITVAQNSLAKKYEY